MSAQVAYTVRFTAAIAEDVLSTAELSPGALNVELKRAPAGGRTVREILERLGGRLSIVSTAEGVCNPAEADQDAYLFDHERLRDLGDFASQVGAGLFLIDGGHIGEDESVHAAWERIGRRLTDIASYCGVTVAVRNASCVRAARGRRHAIGDMDELMDFSKRYGLKPVPTISARSPGRDPELRSLDEEAWGRIEGVVLEIDRDDKAALDGATEIVRTVASPGWSGTLIVDWTVEHSRREERLEPA